MIVPVNVSPSARTPPHACGSADVSTTSPDATPGSHVLEARATDDTGYTQTALQAPPPPNGASGYPAIQVKIT